MSSHHYCMPAAVPESLYFYPQPWRVKSIFVTTINIIAVLVHGDVCRDVLFLFAPYERTYLKDRTFKAKLCSFKY